MLEVPLLSADECRALVEATAQAKAVPDFVPSFSVFDPSTEVPLQDLPADVRVHRQRSGCLDWQCVGEAE